MISNVFDLSKNIVKMDHKLLYNHKALCDLTWQTPCPIKNNAATTLRHSGGQ